MVVNHFYPVGFSALQKEDWNTVRIKMAKETINESNRRKQLRRIPQDKMYDFNRRYT